jgi:hypothetical protein
MSASDALQRVTTLSLLGKQYKLTRLSAVKIMAIVEDYYITQLAHKIKATADILHGDSNSSYKAEFVQSQFAAMPVGYFLEKEARKILTGSIPELLACQLLHASLEPNHKLSIDEVSILFDDAPAEETRPAFSAIMGKEQSPDGAKSKSSRKSSAGRRK